MNKSKGVFGEALACKYLERKGYTLVTKNWTTHWGELDLIMLDTDCLVFVEVKYRSSSNFGDASSALHYYKQRALSRTVSAYLLLHTVRDWRVDIVTITKLVSQYQVQHFQHFPLSSHISYY